MVRDVVVYGDTDIGLLREQYERLIILFEANDIRADDPVEGLLDWLENILWTYEDGIYG